MRSRVREESFILILLAKVAWKFYEACERGGAVRGDLDFELYFLGLRFIVVFIVFEVFFLFRSWW